MNKKLKMLALLSSCCIPGVFFILVSCSEKQTLIIGKQRWMHEDLKVTTFRNGDIIPLAKNENEWNQAGMNEEPACCYAFFDSVKGEKYPVFYNWYAVNDSRGLAPKGYRIPNNRDWGTLFKFVGGDSIAAHMLKASGEGWYPNENRIGGEDKYGFSAKAGVRPSWKFGAPTSGKSGFWWTMDSINGNDSDGYNVVISYKFKNCYIGEFPRSEGAAVRCIAINE